MFFIPLLNKIILIYVLKKLSAMAETGSPASHRGFLTLFEGLCDEITASNIYMAFHMVHNEPLELPDMNSSSWRTPPMFPPPFTNNGEVQQEQQRGLPFQDAGSDKDRSEVLPGISTPGGVI